MFSNELYSSIFIQYRVGPEPLWLCEISSPLKAHLWLTNASLRWTGAVLRSEPVHLREPAHIYVI